MNEEMPIAVYDDEPTDIPPDYHRAFIDHYEDPPATVVPAPSLPKPDIPPLAEDNKHVSELTELLIENDRAKDSQELAELFNYIVEMKRDLEKTTYVLNDIKRDLSEVKESHPAIESTAKIVYTQMPKVNSLAKQASSIKIKFINTCKNMQVIPQ